MDPNIARAYEAVTVAARRLRAHLRYEGVAIEGDVKIVTFNAPVWMLRDWVESIDHSELVRADARLDDPDERPPPPHYRPRLARRTKINLPRETLDE